MIPQSGIDALIFDYDGVIANTEHLHWRSWAEILEPLGIHLTWEQYCEVGRGVHDAHMIDTFRKLVQDPSLLSGVEEQNALRKRIMRDMCISKPPIYPATIEMLIHLKGLKGYRLGLVTSSERSDVEPVLRTAGIYHCFDALVFGEDVTRHKPAPDPYLLICSRLGIKTGLVFEDSDAGITSAKQAGLAVAFIADPEQLPKIVHRELSAHHPLKRTSNL
jgi:beta-phosphoglucomutase